MDLIRVYRKPTGTVGDVWDAAGDLAGVAPRWTAETLAAGAGRAVESGSGVPAAAWALLRSLAAAGFGPEVRRGLARVEDSARRRVLARVFAPGDFTGESQAKRDD